MTPDLTTMNALAVRQLAIDCVEELQGRSDAAYDAYSAAFDALDDPATILVFPLEVRRMELSFKYDGELLRSAVAR